MRIDGKIYQTTVGRVILREILLLRLAAENPGPFPTETICHLFKEIFKASLDLKEAELAAAERLVVGSGSLLSADGEAPTTGGPLTDRETEVLGLLAKGLANKQIAVELGISEHTVKFHVSSIYTKLDASSRTQAVREGLRRGLIAL